MSELPTRSERRVARIHEVVRIDKVLEGYGYRVQANTDREQQFSCDLHGDGTDSKPSARVYPSTNQWYCVDIDAPILTAQGWVRLGSVRPGVDTLLDGVSEWHTTPAYFDRGVRPVVRVETTAGYEVAVTPDHEVFVVGRGWVEASCLRPGDVLDIPKPVNPMFPTGLDLPFDPSDINTTSYGNYPNLSLPSVWSEEIGVVLGYIFGDGWVVTRRSSKGSPGVGLTAHSSDAEEARKVFRLLQGWSNRRGCERHRTDTTTLGGFTYIQDQYVWTVGNGGLVEFFRRLGLDKKQGATERRLPQTLWSAPECAVRGFLRGIYATDGSVVRPADRTAVRVNLYSVSKGFLQDVQLLLLQFGIHSRLQGGASTRQSKLLCLQLATGSDVLVFRDRVGIGLPRKQALLDAYNQRPNGKRPFRALVASVTDAGVRHVADVAMPVEHSFVAGGIRVHNCFACPRSRDAIQTVREKENLSFHDAIEKLEKTYGLPSLPWEESDRESKPTDEVAAILDAPYADPVRVRAERMIRAITTERAESLSRVLKMWEAFDRARVLEEGGDPEPMRSLLTVLLRPAAQ